MGITAKQIRTKTTKRKVTLVPKVDQHEAEADVRAFGSSLDIWSIGFVDIETTGLGADFGHILCACIKPSSREKIITLRIDDYAGYKQDLCNDKQLVIDIKNSLEEFDVVCHYNGDMFDLPFIDTRLTIHGEKRSHLVHSIDLLPIVKRKLRLNSNRLDTVSTALGLGNQKTKLEPRIWMKASHGDKAALNYIVEHCEADVLVLEEAFRRLKGFVDTIFRRR